MSAFAPLAPREAYPLWAPTYDGENVLSALDERAARALTPPLPGLVLLDAACGTARRLVFRPGEGPRVAVGVDLVCEMLLRARLDASRERRLLAGDLRALPVARGAFDVAWCRLAAGHLPSLERLYDGLALALGPGGAALVTDFHPEAVRRGHVRAFRDGAGTARLVEHHVHEAARHEGAAGVAGLELERRLDLAPGPEARPLYEVAGALGRWERDRDLPLLAAFLFRKGAA